MSDVEVPFTRTIRLMRRYLSDAEVGLNRLVELAQKYGILEGAKEIDAEDVVKLSKEIRTSMRTLGFEGTAMLVQAMLLAGDPMLARVVGIELERPREERSN